MTQNAFARRSGLGLLVGFLAGPAAAAVIDIAPDGRVTVVDGPSVQLSSDPGAARPILRPAPPPARAARASAPRAEVMDAIDSAASSQRFSRDLIEAVAWQESRFHPEAVSPKGARGVMQLMPATARAMGVDSRDIDGNVHGGAAYLRSLVAHYNGDLVRALAAYNAGPGAVDRYGGVPPFKETRAYVDAILEHLAEQAVPVSPAVQRRSSR